MFWSEKLEDWKNGNILTYPYEITSQFLWETSPISKYVDNEFLEKFIPNKNLNCQTQNYSSFNQYINQSKTNTCVFNNLNNTSRLIIPMPDSHKEYTSLKLFIDNSDYDKQVEFWKTVAQEIEVMLQKHEKIWVSTHGLGVPYLHVRIDLNPKYYVTQEFIS